MIRFKKLSCALGSAIQVFAFASSGEAAFDVTLWNLSTRISQHVDGESLFDREDIVDISNPLDLNSLAQLGPNAAAVEYDYAWLRHQASGSFNTSITHAIRDPHVRPVSRGEITIVPDEDIVVAVDASMSYSHTPGDEYALLFGFSIRDVTANQWLYQEVRYGGNLFLLPSAGVLDIQRQDILMAGRTYRLDYVLDDDNTSDSLPTGILDASGFLNISIVPEINTACLLLPATLFLLRKPRRAASPRP